MNLKRLFRDKFFRNIGILLSGTAVAQAIALLAYPVLSRIYTTAEMGTFSLYLSIVSITSILATGRYELAFLLPANKKDASALLKFSIWLSLIVSIFLFMFILVFHNFFVKLSGDPNLGFWLWFIPLSTFLPGIFQSMEYWFTRCKHYGTIATGNVSQSLVNSGTKLAAYKLFANGGGLIFGVILGQLAGAVYFVARFFITKRAGYENSNRQEMLAQAKKYYKFPLFRASLNLINTLSSNFPVFIIAYYFNMATVGLFSLGVTMVFKPMNMVANSVRQVLYERVTYEYNNGQSIQNTIYTIIKQAALLMLIPFAVAAIFGPWLFDFIFGTDWREAGVFMQLMLPWLFSAFLMNLSSFVPDMFGQQQKALFLDVIKLILRFLGLAVGGISGNIYLTIGLFSGLSLLVNIYLLIWYHQVLTKNDIRTQS